jgi:hypothetical protein
MIIQGNSIFSMAREILSNNLPPQWSIEEKDGFSPTQGTGELILRSPGGQTGIVRFVVRKQLNPREVVILADQEKRSRENGTLPVAVAPYLTPSSRARLEGEGWSYIDLSGTVRLALSEPGLFINVTGATRARKKVVDRPGRSLKGSRAVRVALVLVSLSSIPGVRELAALAGVDPGYASRIFRFLSDEALVKKDGRRLASIDWQGILRRLAVDSPIDARGQHQLFLAPRGLDHFLASLRALEKGYALSGSLVASSVCPIAAPRLVTLYVDNLEKSPVLDGLRPAEKGANVYLVEPTDPWIFSRTRKVDGAVHAPLPLVVMDLLSGPGRSPAEGEELIRWMAEHPEAWRG